MESHDPISIANQAQEESQRVNSLAEDVLHWFLSDEHVGNVYPRDNVVEELQGELDVGSALANRALAATVGDIVDPVQQITVQGGVFVGVVDYKVYSDEGAYGYVHFDDSKGKQKRVVCARCVQKEETDTNITHATQGEGTANDDATWKQLRNKVTSHYASSHSKAPDEIEAGATLLSGTTIAGNTAFHAGNDGEGSGLDAEFLQGETPSSIGGGASSRRTSL